jgi:hypothetical protein
MNVYELKNNSYIAKIDLEYSNFQFLKPKESETYYSRITVQFHSTNE